MATLNLTDLGFIIEGIVEQDPMDDRFRIRTVQNGEQVLIDPQDLLKKYRGQEVKLTLASLENILRIQSLLEDGGGVLGEAVMPEDVGAKVTYMKKPS
jgi:hypothetical protein